MSMNSLPESLSGYFLLASPSLMDPHFRRTILLLSHHSKKDGAVGIVLNRPLNLRVRDIASEELAPHLREIPLFYGGPVGADQPVLIGLRWQEKAGIEMRNFLSGKDPVPTEWLSGLRMFVGHAGWSPGQLESEIEQQSWIILPPAREFLDSENPDSLWKHLLSEMDPMLKLLSDCPDDPSRN